MPKILSTNKLKYIAVIAMTIDHIAWVFVPNTSTAFYVLHLIGRLTAPIMAYFIAEGFFYTSNEKRYVMRLFVFWIVSCIPYSLLFNNGFPIEIYQNVLQSADKLFVYHNMKLYINVVSHNLTILIRLKTNVIFTLFLGLLTPIVIQSEKLNALFKVFIVSGICLLSFFGDWSYFMVLFIFIFYYFRDNNNIKWVLYYCVCLIYLTSIQEKTDLIKFGILFAPIVLLMYNGKKGSNNKFNKWFFYFYYPVHLLLLYLLKKVFLLD